jgi:hypothetical protein
MYLTGLAMMLASLSLLAAPLTWYPGAFLPTPASGSATVVNGGKIILTGGDAFAFYGYPLSYPFSFAATNNYWTTLAPFYSLNIAPGAVVSDGNLIIYGGSDGTSAQNVTLNNNLSGDTVPALPNLNVPRAYLGSAPDRNGNAYAFGGLDDNGNPLASAEKLNPTATKPVWTYIASLPQARLNFPAVFNRTNYIYIFGGLTNPAAGSEISSVLRYSVSGNSWTSLAPLPVAVAGSAATLGPDGNIYVVGGTSGGISTNVVQVYNPAANAWTLATPLPEGLSLTSVGVDSWNRLVVAGGVDTNGNDTADVWYSQPIGLADSAPVFTNFPATAAAYRGAYVSAINAAGNPPPVYSLVSGPPGMQVDYFSGTITWTPQALNEIGTNPVTVMATNYAGATNYTFNIVVPNPGPSLPTNFTVVSVTDNSATISWSPQDPAVGPVTYSIAIPHAYHSPRGSGGGVTYQTIATGITTNVITIGGLSPGSSASYALSVSAIGGGIPYSYSTWFSAYTTAPQSPANVSLAGLTSTSVTLDWTPSPGLDQGPQYSIITSYAIAEFIPGGSGVPSTSKLWLTGIPTNTLTATVTGLTPGQSHYWYVAGVDAQGFSSGYTGLPFTFVNVANPLPQPAALAAVSSAPATGGFQFNVQPNVSQTTLIQATTNISDPNAWTTIATNPPAGTSFNFTDTNSGQFPTRYYRVVTQ